MTRGRWRLETHVRTCRLHRSRSCHSSYYRQFEGPDVPLRMDLHLYTLDAPTWAALGAIVNRGGVYYAARTLTSN